MQRRDFIALAALGTAPAWAQPPAPVRTRVETSLGGFVIEVDPRVAPLTVANFLRYVDGGHLDGVSVYRIVTQANQAPGTKHKIEVVQWGIKQQEGQASPHPAIPLERTRDTGLRHRDGTVSMARAEPDSGAGDFFICIGDQPSLDFGGGRNPDGQGFAAFGQVVEGMDVVRAIHALGGAEQFLKDTIPVRSVRRM